MKIILFLFALGQINAYAKDYNPADYSTGDEDADLEAALEASRQTHKEERKKMTDNERAVDDAYGNNVDEE